jgi:hypothetical protein
MPRSPFNTTYQTAGHAARAAFGTYAEVSEGYAALVSGRGDPSLQADGGTDFEDGTWLHWYVVCGDLIVDVTADQFREPRERDDFRVVVTSICDSAYRGGHVRQAGRTPR